MLQNKVYYLNLEQKLFPILEFCHSKIFSSTGYWKSRFRPNLRMNDYIFQYIPITTLNCVVCIHCESGWLEDLLFDWSFEFFLFFLPLRKWQNPNSGRDITSSFLCKVTFTLHSKIGIMYISRHVIERTQKNPVGASKKDHNNKICYFRNGKL